ncbi:MAG TPA: cytochrome c peroxidase [Kofleriaceae bacterium]|jgi:cytochrome c peroxidase
MYDRILTTTVFVALLGACGNDAHGTAEAASRTPSATPSASAPEAPVSGINPRLLRRFRPLRADMADPARPRTQAMIDLGRTLYFDARLSAEEDVSCNSCHPLDRYGADGEVTSKGHHGARGARNSPSTFHAAGLVAQFWDGRSPDVEHQASGPMFNPKEMGSSPERVLATIGSMPAYVAMFNRAFPGGKALSMEHVGDAIGAFERGLVAPGRWDRYLAGDNTALTAVEVEGLRVFATSGCVSCHTGEFLGGTSFQTLGAVVPWPDQDDHGRGDITHKPEDDMMFRVPSLRDVTKTGPYFHDGSGKHLDDAIDMMATYQLGINLTEAQRASIAAWMGSLTGELPADYIRTPSLPESTSTTPAPETK